MISKDLKSLTAPANKRTRNADEYLVRQHNKLAPYESLDHFVFAGEEELGDEDFRPLMHHMLNLRIELAGLLWFRDLSAAWVRFSNAWPVWSESRPQTSLHLQTIWRLAVCTNS